MISTKLFFMALLASLAMVDWVTAASKPSRSCKTNAECLRQGLPLLKPKRLHNSKLLRRDTTTTFTTSRSIFSYSVPYAGTYIINARGASGGGSSEFNGVGGLGAYLNSTVVFTSPQTLYIVVGEQGQTQGRAGGGGGMTAIFISTELPQTVGNSEPVLIVGSGGGAGTSGVSNGNTGSPTMIPTPAFGVGDQGDPGTAGDGGEPGKPYGSGGGGSGWFSSGGTSANGAQGGKNLDNGFKGGQGQETNDFNGSGTYETGGNGGYGGGGGGGLNGGAGGSGYNGAASGGLNGGGGGSSFWADGFGGVSDQKVTIVSSGVAGVSGDGFVQIIAPSPPPPP